MATLTDPAASIPSAQLVDIRDVRASDLRPLLKEEAAEWRERFDWDFSSSADLVERFVDQQALGGYVLLESGEPAGYSYFVNEDHKGLIGDLYVRRKWRGFEAEYELLEASVNALRRTPFVTRIETQLMLLGSARPRPAILSRHLTLFERNFMRIDLRRVASLARAHAPVIIEQWSERKQEAAAQLVPRAYEGHIDSEINDQYRSPAGARRFLNNIIQYPGCGSFFRPGSFVALDRDSGEVVGMSLGSLVAPETGHITQICLEPRMRGKSVGYELLRQSLVAFQRAGCRQSSLTVTAANKHAVELYQRLGFDIIQQFWAFVWAGF